MRDRLIELYEKAIEEYEKTNKAQFKKNFICDYLLKNGVIVPPCKVGDKVYGVFEDDVLDDEIILIEVIETAIYLSTCSARYMWLNGYLYSEMLDQKLYFTKEEAEKALKGGVE